ncbi:unnamed protein product [Anisakis simplex]|uniref:BESS domain-containing protein n=2 Tax=Anisakis simplex TaxID=6269 RepID=A0A0M3J5J9_ANISI|nr:unnamed protein product [Anisakis simplex]
MMMIAPKYRKIRNQRRKELRAKKLEELKIKKMREGMEEEPVEDEEEPEEEEEKRLEGDGDARKEVHVPDEAVSSVAGNVPEIPEKKRELEEGEMSSESSSSSSATSPSSSSSSSDDNDDEQSQNTARDRRRKRRIQKKRARGAAATAQFSLGSAQSPHFEALFKKLYEHRHALLRSLPATHKHAFAGVLNQILSSPQGMTRAQHDQMTLFMRTFSAQNMHNK